LADLKILTMSDVQTESVNWLWRPYLPSGKISIIQGDPGEGKTTMALAVAAAVTTGTPLPGDASYSFPESVIFQTAEDGLADTIKPRLELLGADCDRVHIIDEGERQLSLSDERIEQAIVKMDAKLFILDPLQAYLGGADMHSVNGVRPLLKSLGAVADRTSCAVVIIGHLNKKGGRSQYRGLGSIDIPAAARSILTVGHSGIDENMRAVVHSKSNLAPPGPSLAFGFDPVGGFTWLGDYDITIDELLNGGKKNEDKSESQFARARKLIETALANGPVPSVDMYQMAEERGISSKTLNRAKDAMGVRPVKIKDRWYWELPIDGEFTEYSDNQQSQGCQECQDGQAKTMSTLAALSILPGMDHQNSEHLDGSESGVV